MIEGGDDFLGLAAVGFYGDGLAPVVGVHIAKDAALRVEQESIDAVAGGEIADVVGDHAVEPAGAVAAGERELGAEAQVVNSTSVLQGSKLRLRIGKARRGRSSAVIRRGKRVGVP